MIRQDARKKAWNTLSCSGISCNITLSTCVKSWVWIDILSIIIHTSNNTLKEHFQSINRG